MHDGSFSLSCLHPPPPTGIFLEPTLKTYPEQMLLALNGSFLKSAAESPSPGGSQRQAGQGWACLTEILSPGDQPLPHEESKGAPGSTACSWKEGASQRKQGVSRLHNPHLSSKGPFQAGAWHRAPSPRNSLTQPAHQWRRTASLLQAQRNFQGGFIKSLQDPPRITQRCRDHPRDQLAGGRGRWSGKFLPCHRPT